MLFKFRAINKRMIESLVNAEVYFSSPANLNDPFDCQIDIEQSLDNAISKVGGIGEGKLNLLKENFSVLFSQVQADIKTYLITIETQLLSKPTSCCEPSKYASML